MAKRGVQKNGTAGPEDGAVSTATAAATIVIEAQLDLAGAAALHGELRQALSNGALVIDMSEGQPTQPAIQVLVAARNSARAGHDVSFSDRAAAVLSHLIEEDV